MDGLMGKRLETLVGVLEEALEITRGGLELARAGTLEGRRLLEVGQELRRYTREADGLCRGIRVRRPGRSVGASEGSEGAPGISGRVAGSGPGVVGYGSR